jgi:hypothetical protein
MTTRGYHFEQVHSQTPIDSGFSIAGEDLIGDIFGCKTGVGKLTYLVCFA